MEEQQLVYRSRLNIIVTRIIENTENTRLLLPTRYGRILDEFIQLGGFLYNSNEIIVQHSGEYILIILGEVQDIRLVLFIPNNIDLLTYIVNPTEDGTDYQDIDLSLVRMNTEPITDTYTTEYDKTSGIFDIIKNKNLDELKHFAKEYELDSNDYAILHHTVMYGSLEMVVWLLAMGFVEKFPGYTLYTAITTDRDDEYEQARIVTWLLADTQFYPFNRLNSSYMFIALSDCVNKRIAYIVKDVCVSRGISIPWEHILQKSITELNITMVEWVIENGYVPTMDDLEKVEEIPQEEEETFFAIRKILIDANPKIDY